MQSLKAAMKPSIDPKRENKTDRTGKTDKKNQDMQDDQKTSEDFWLTPLCNNIEDPSRQNLFRTSDTVDDKEASK